jgi:hypothetical protein
LIPAEPEKEDAKHLIQGEPSRVEKYMVSGREKGNNT